MSIKVKGKIIEPKKLSNKKKLEEGIDCIRKLGYTPYNINTTDTYFVIQYKDNSICHFRIKEIPGYIFAFWNNGNFDNYLKQVETQGVGNTWADSLEINPKSELIFFTQHEDDLDKFKPSRSGFVIGLRRDTWIETNEKTGRDIRVCEWYTTELEEVLDFMKKHKYKTRLFATSQIRNVWEWPYNDIKTYIMYRKHVKSVKKYKKKDKKARRKDLKAGLMLVKRLKCYDAYLVDESSCIIPEYHLLIRLKNNISDIRRKNKEDKLLYKYDNCLHLDIEECRLDTILNKVEDLDDRTKEYYKRAEKRFIKVFKNTKKEMLKVKRNDLWQFNIIAQNFKDEEIEERDVKVE